MKTPVRIFAVILTLAICFAIAGCAKVDKNYGVEPDVSSESENTAVEIPEISSEDTVMPTYFDISLYDVENYADIYLGKKFKFKVTYAGSELTVPTTYKKMTSKGWSLMETDECSADAIILAGKYMSAQFENDFGTQITAVFHNASNSSVSLKKCKIVKFKIPENGSDNPESVYGQFWVNGINNESTINDIVEYLGAPSHFYAVNEAEYYFDYFISKDDKRNKITVYVNPTDDSVTAIEFANFK